VRALKETGQDERTYVMFTSDNGFLLGEHRYAKARPSSTRVVRVPLIVRGPGVPRG